MLGTTRRRAHALSVRGTIRAGQTGSVAPRGARRRRLGTPRALIAAAAYVVLLPEGRRSWPWCDLEAQTERAAALKPRAVAAGSGTGADVRSAQRAAHWSRAAPGCARGTRRDRR